MVLAWVLDRVRLFVFFFILLVWLLMIMFCFGLFFRKDLSWLSFGIDFCLSFVELEVKNILWSIIGVLGFFIEIFVFGIGCSLIMSW